eukprot:2742872-Rhodomonas_salina.2
MAATNLLALLVAPDGHELLVAPYSASVPPSAHYHTRQYLLARSTSREISTALCGSTIQHAGTS